MRVLIITDHVDRCLLSPGVLDISIDFLVPERLACRIDPGHRAHVKTYSTGGIKSDSNRFDLVVVDIESDESRVPLQAIGKLLAPDGTLITLSWDASWRRMIRTIPRYFGLPRFSSGQQGERTERWYFAVEPSLRKPRYLVRGGLRQLLPALSHSAIKRWLVRSGAFFLLPHHSALIASSSKSPSPVIEVLRQLIPDSASDDRLANCIESVYVSSTQVLLVRASYAGETYFLQFPLTSASLERVRNRKEICEYIHKHSAISFVPRPLNVQHSLAVPCSIERGVAGNSIERKFPRLSEHAAATYYSNALLAMRGIHTRFGSVVEFGENEFAACIQTKLEPVVRHLAENHVAARALGSLERFLRSELNGRAVVISLSHGDFKIGNCLFDSRSRVTGIVDWDMASKSDLALFDLASIRGRSIRDRKSLSLTDLVLNSGEYPDEFETVCASYFQETQTDPVPLFTLMWMYWIDRVSKQFLYNTHVNEKWIADNVLPVIERLDEKIWNLIEE